MFDEATMIELRQRLRETGCVSITDGLARRLYVADTRLLGDEQRGMLLAYEKAGCAVFDGSRPLNAFQLVTAGFQMALATVVAGFVNELLQVPPVAALPPPVRKTRGKSPAKRAKAHTKAKRPNKEKTNDHR